MIMQQDRVSVSNNEKEAVFKRVNGGWKPDWFYMRERCMLRFKDHEWLSLGHVHPILADEVCEDGDALTFSATSRYGDTDVDWCVHVAPDDRSGGFAVECEFTPRESIELLEAYSTFEAPYEYDGTEHVTSVIGQNPVVRWEGSERITPPVWKNPAWLYAREQSARCTGPCNVPILCHTISNPDGSNARYTTIVGDWNACDMRDVFVTPTRIVDMSTGEWGGKDEGQLRGYKYIMGALNWSSAYTKDPNVVFEAGKRYRQRVIIDYASEMPGGTLDKMTFEAWDRAAAFDIPEDGKVEACERAKDRDVTWTKATSWLEDVFTGEGAEGLFLPDEGIATYAPGTRPKAGGYRWSWWRQWSGLFHYRALMLGDDELAGTCRQHDKTYAQNACEKDYHGRGIGGRVSILPSLHWISGPGQNSVLADALEPAMRATLDGSRNENGRTRRMDDGAQAASAEAFLLAAQAYQDEAFTEQALILLEEINQQLDGAFWAFNCGERGNLMHGGQIRPFGHGCAVLANMLAHRLTGQEEYLRAAHRFARYLLSINYVTHNSSDDPDFDWRGWANGSNAGRDQIAEFPPWETLASIMRVMPMMNVREAGDDNLESGFYDAVWYIARTGLAQFPAARQLKRVYDDSMNVRYVHREELGSERDFYDTLPYLAYENPHDQTLLASYQGTDCLLAELVFGGRLADAADERLNVMVPGAVLMDEELLEERSVVLWNPTPRGIESDVWPVWKDEPGQRKKVEVPSRKPVSVKFEK